MKLDIIFLLDEASRSILFFKKFFCSNSNLNRISREFNKVSTHLGVSSLSRELLPCYRVF